MHKRLKILVIAPYNLPVPPFAGYGGTQRVVFDVVQRLAETDDVTLFAPKGSCVSDKIDLKTYEGTDQKQNETTIARHLDVRSYDIIYTHLDAESLVEKLANYESPLVVAAHYYFDVQKINWLHSTGCFLQTQSRAQAAFFRRVTPRVIDVVQSVAIEKIEPSMNVLTAAKLDEITLPELIRQKKRNRDYLLILSRICDYKGQKTAIEIAQHCRTPIIIAGAPVYEHEGDYRYFQVHIQPLIDGESVIYFGNADEQQKLELMRFAKASLLPTGFENPDWHEAFGRVVNESLACGTPVIAANRGAMPEQIVDGECGYLFETFDEAVAAVGKIDKISRPNCVRRAEEHLNANRFVYDLRRAILKILEKEELSESNS